MLVPEPLSICQRRENAVHRLTPIGELDLATAPRLERAFDAVLNDRGAETIVVDLTELSFFDSTGVHLLLRMHAACHDGDRLRIINGSRAVARVLDLAGVCARLPIIARDQDPVPGSR